MAHPTRRIKVSERKLGRERAWGRQLPRKIELDPRLQPRPRMSVLIHEAFHQAYPEMSEAQVDHGEKVVCKILWSQNYRRVAQ